jgi:Ca2+-binding RTX toxin-like protein
MTSKLRQIARLPCLLAAGLSLWGCSGRESPAGPPLPTPALPWAYEGTSQVQAAQLAAACSVVGTAASIGVADGETVSVSYRASDSKVIFNALTAGGGPCEFSPTSTLKVTASGTGVALGRTVILDYGAGRYMLGAGAIPGIVIDLSIGGGTTNATDTLQVRGSTLVDSFALGAGVAPSRALNINAGTTAGLDSIADVTFKSVEVTIISTGAGDDVIDASGVFGTGAAFPGDLQLLSGAGADHVTGGAGNDQITPGDGDDIVDGGGGNDTFKMGAASDGADTINAAAAAPGNDTVDYSARTNDLVVILDGTTASGESAGAEGDKISVKIATILGGAGNDVFTIPSGSTLAHLVLGGKGDDTFTGGAGPDVFDGELGDDVCVGANSAMSYSTRSAAMTVTVCDPSGDCSASNDDGDRSLTIVQYSGTAASAADNVSPSDHLVVINALTNMTVASTMGRTLRLVGFDTAANNNSAAGYAITAVNSISSVTINVTPNGSFLETSLAAASGLTWTLIGPEKDNVECASVIGGTGADILTGDVRNNVLRGGLGNDTLTGGSGNDTLLGEDGADDLYGGAGDDSLVGSTGADHFYGGDGNDVLQGDEGLDTFQCDGPNASGGGAGAAPGDSDFTVDADVAGGESVAGCEY